MVRAMNSPQPLSIPKHAPGLPELDPRQQAILEQNIPRFSDAEYTRRRAAVESVMDESGVKHLVVYGANWQGPLVGWLTGWPTSTEAALIVTLGECFKLFIQHYNHVPQARQLALDADVEWGGTSTIPTVIEELNRRGAKSGDVAVMGGITIGRFRQLENALGPIIDLNRNYNELRAIKSDEEMDWMRIAAALTDLGIQALAEQARPGMTEHELGAIVEGGYLGYGATTMIHFFGITPMDNPNICVPPQYTSRRLLQAGDVVFTEITAVFREYSGQILRTYTVEADPTPLYRDLHETADAAFDAVTGVLKDGATTEAVIKASSVIEDAGFSIWDDLVHGYGGGYLAPVLGCKSRPAGPVPDYTYRSGMCFVVQPNVVTTDHKAGVQTGELIRITDTGVESLHRVPRGMGRLGG